MSAKRRNALGRVALTAVLFNCVPTAKAHHSFAMYETQRSVTLKGTVREFHYQNPHTLLVITVTNAAGEAVDYTIETGGAFYLTKNQGWKTDSLKPGDKVVALIRPLRDGSPGGDLLKITVGDGHELIARQPPYPPEAPP